MSTLDKAIEIAARAHAGQVQHDGRPYILHPLEVMMNVESIDAKIVAVLHDVVEDCDLTLEDLRQKGFSEAILTGVDLMTKKQDQDYMDYIRQILPNPLAREVKLADLNHNMDLRRLPHLPDTEFARMKKYHNARTFLLSSQ